MIKLCAKLSDRVTAGKTVNEVRCMIDNRVFGEQNRLILTKLLIDGETYEQIADDLDMSPRGLYYKVKRATKYIQ